MASIPNSPEEQFEQQAANDWNLKRLYKDLADAKRQAAPHKRKGLTAVEKQHLCGLLCGYSPAEIAEKLFKRARGVEADLCKTVYRYVEQLTTRLPNTVRNWRDIPEWLEAAGYKSKSPESAESEGAIAHLDQNGEKAANGLAVELERTASNNPNLVEPQGGEDLMSLATRILEQFGFDEKFKVSRAFQHIGYRLKNSEKEAKSYQLILFQRKDGLCISIRQDILNPHLLNLKYWEYTDALAEADLFTKARFWVLPSRKDIFLDSLHPNYWNSLQAEGKTVGDFCLNTCRLVDPVEYLWGQYIVSGSPECKAVPSILLDEFNPDTLSDGDTYLVVNYDKRFPDTWQVFINSSGVLEEFLSYFAKILCVDVELEQQVAYPHQDSEEAANDLAIGLEGTTSKTPNLVELQGGEDLISLATRMLEQLGFDQKFEVIKELRYLEYRLKTYEKGDEHYQLVLSQRKEGLYVSIPQDILSEDVVLTLFYYVNDSHEYGCGVAEITLAKIWILPSKKDIFLESIPDKYWNLLRLKLKGKRAGNVSLNETDDDGSGYHYVIPSIAVDKFIGEFRAEALSDNNSYLVLSEDRLFPKNLRGCISSKAFLQEFIEYFGKILMEEQYGMSK